MSRKVELDLAMGDVGADSAEVLVWRRAQEHLLKSSVRRASIDRMTLRATCRSRSKIQAPQVWRFRRARMTQLFTALQPPLPATNILEGRWEPVLSAGDIMPGASRAVPVELQHSLLWLICLGKRSESL